MNDFKLLLDTHTWLLPLLITLVIWEAIWKLIALWRAARNNNLTAFILIALINSVGILPISYLLMQRKKATT